MKRSHLIYFLIITLTVICCKKVYQPPAVTAQNNFLVVEGVINTGTAAITTIKLSRTRSLGDTSLSLRTEKGAQVQIESESGNTFLLSDKGNGVYQ